MSRARFPLLLALLALVVSVGSFVAANAAFDDGEADPPPQRPGDGSSSGATGSTGSTSTTAAPVNTGELPSPSWILVVSSDAADEAGAGEIAQQIAAKGHPSGVLRSDDYPSLNPGFWVAYAGPYEDAAAAEAALAPVSADGFGSSYVRCAGTVKDCRGGDGNAEDDEDD